MTMPMLGAAAHLKRVKYEIFGPLALRAAELEREGHEVLKLNIGNPASFGFPLPKVLEQAIAERLGEAGSYCHHQGRVDAREAIVTQQKARGVTGVAVEDVFVGHGVSELVMMAMHGLLNPGDEVLLPCPDYPLWTAATVTYGGVPVYYPCAPENDYVPRVEDIRARITERTRAIVVINPNNPTGAVYPRSTLLGIGELSARHKLLVCSDEIYDGLLFDDTEFVPMASLVEGTLCASFAGLTKSYQSCGLRVGWMSLSGEKARAGDYLEALDLLAAMRLCSSIPGQLAVPTALSYPHAARALTSAGGRLHASRQAVLDAVDQSSFLCIAKPRGAMYAFLRVDTTRCAGFDDQAFARTLLEREHILISPGASFNMPTRDHLRLTLLPEAPVLRHVMSRIEALLHEV